MIDLKAIDKIRKRHDEADWYKDSCETCVILKQYDLLVKDLHDMTPGGSEFAFDPNRCLKYLIDKISGLQEKLIECKKYTKMIIEG